MLMARIEGEESGDKGRVREWLARAVHAPRDPAWVADGVVSDKWAPVSPVTGAFDAFQWRVPADALDAADTEALAAKLEELVKLGAPTPEAAKPVASASAEPAAVRSASAKPSREAEDVTIVTSVSGDAHEDTPRSGTDAPERAGRQGQGAAPTAAKPEVKVVEGRLAESKAGEKKVLDPGMFIAPNAPDDPGVAGGDAAEGKPATRPAPRVVASGQR
jgi:HemY protein